MSTAVLNNLLTYLTSTLSRSNMKWLGEHLIENAQASGVKKSAKKNEYYESDQFYKDLDDAEADIAKGAGKVVMTSQDLESLFV